MEVAGLSTVDRYHEVVPGKVRIVVGMVVVVLVQQTELGLWYGLVYGFPPRHQFVKSAELVPFS